VLLAEGFSTIDQSSPERSDVSLCLASERRTLLNRSEKDKVQPGSHERRF
jgi:hypothetical protein